MHSLPASISSTSDLIALELKSLTQRLRWVLHFLASHGSAWCNKGMSGVVRRQLETVIGENLGDSLHFTSTEGMTLHNGDRCLHREQTAAAVESRSEQSF